MSTTPVVILAGGKGFRMREITETTPKALAPIGPMPIIFHVMSIYSYFGYKRFIICLGYKGEIIREFFMNYRLKLSTLRIRLGKEIDILDSGFADLEGAEITLVETGLETNTGGRIKKIEKYIDAEIFLANYCDGLTDVNVRDVEAFHRKMGKIATLLAVRPMSRYGVIELKNGLVTSLREKPKLEGYINGGYFVFNRRIFDYLSDNSVLEREPLQRLAQEGQLAAYKYDGFWYAMDTFKEFEELNSLWETGVMPMTGFKGKPPWVRTRI